MRETLFEKWAEIKDDHKLVAIAPKMVGLMEQLQILETLYGMGIHQIPNESFTVPFLIKDRQRQVREIQEKP